MPNSENENQPTIISFDETLYSGLKERAEYKRKKKADAPSYEWDALVERFIKLGDPALVHPGIKQDNKDTEQGLRLIASEGRFRRRMLVDALFGMLRAAKIAGRRHARLFTTSQQSERAYIFLALPMTPEHSYEEYRHYRAAVLHAYCRCAKLRLPEANTFVGIALDHPSKTYKGGTEDLLVFECDVLTDEERADLEKYRKEFGILGDDLELKKFHDDEYPTSPGARVDPTITRDPRHASQRQAEKHEKRKRRMAKDSRRRNRRHK